MRLSFDLQLLLRELTVTAPQQPVDELVRDLFFELAGLVNPYLPASRVVPLWDYLSSQPGYPALSGQTRDWFELHRAVGLRDADSVAKLAGRLIGTIPKDKFSPQEAGYLLTAGLAGFLATGNKSEARSLLEIFDRQQEPLKSPPLYLQLLQWQINAKQ